LLQIITIKCSATEAKGKWLHCRLNASTSLVLAGGDFDLMKALVNIVVFG